MTRREGLRPIREVRLVGCRPGLTRGTHHVVADTRGTLLFTEHKNIGYERLMEHIAGVDRSGCVWFLDRWRAWHGTPGVPTGTSPGDVSDIPYVLMTRQLGALRKARRTSEVVLWGTCGELAVLLAGVPTRVPGTSPTTYLTHPVPTEIKDLPRRKDGTVRGEKLWVFCKLADCIVAWDFTMPGVLQLSKDAVGRAMIHEESLKVVRPFRAAGAWPKPGTSL